MDRDTDFESFLTDLVSRLNIREVLRSLPLFSKNVYVLWFPSVRTCICVGLVYGFPPFTGTYPLYESVYPRKNTFQNCWSDYSII